ncbi:MAG: hypothetical protein NW200_06700 [Hyphomonadaceae bacterium]|nr:hypothetical protein [Hyphomonadaceae bacterium]
MAFLAYTLAVDTSLAELIDQLCDEDYADLMAGFSAIEDSIRLFARHGIAPDRIRTCSARLTLEAAFDADIGRFVLVSILVDGAPRPPTQTAPRPSPRSPETHLKQYRSEIRFTLPRRRRLSEITPAALWFLQKISQSSSGPCAMTSTLKIKTVQLHDLKHLDLAQNNSPAPDVISPWIVGNRRNTWPDASSDALSATDREVLDHP